MQVGVSTRALYHMISHDRLRARPLGSSTEPACDWKHTANKCPLSMDAAEVRQRAAINIPGP